MPANYDSNTNTTITSSGVSKISVINQGDNYTAVANVKVIGDGVGCTATSTLSAGRAVKTLAIGNGGSGYGAGTIATVTGGGGTGAVVKLTIAGGVITGAVLTNTGDNFTSTPTIVLSNTGGGTGATITATVSTGRVVKQINVTAPGNGYTKVIVQLSGGGGTGATAGAPITFASTNMVYGTSNGRIFSISDPGNGTLANYFVYTGAVAGSSPVVSVAGSDTNVAFGFISQGTGGLTFATGNGTVLSVSDPTTGAIVNSVNITGGVANVPVTFQAVGSTNAGLVINANGSGSVAINKVAIAAGSIDNTVIGANTPASAAFSNVGVTGILAYTGSLSLTTISASAGAAITGGLVFDKASGDASLTTATFPAGSAASATSTLTHALSQMGSSLPLTYFENNANLSATPGVLSTAGYYISSATAPNGTNPSNISPGFIINQALAYCSYYNTINQTGQRITLTVAPGFYQLGTTSIQIPNAGNVRWFNHEDSIFEHTGDTSGNGGIIQAANPGSISLIPNVHIKNGRFGKKGDIQYTDANGNVTLNGDPHVFVFTPNTQPVPGSNPVTYLPGGVLRFPVYLGDNSVTNGNGGTSYYRYQGNGICLYATNLILENIEICKLGSGRAFLISGINFKILSPQIWAGTVDGSQGGGVTAGIRINWGVDGLIYGVRGWSGDDFLQFVPDNTWNQALNGGLGALTPGSNIDTKRVSYVNCRGCSMSNHFIAVTLALTNNYEAIMVASSGASYVVNNQTVVPMSALYGYIKTTKVPIAVGMFVLAEGKIQARGTFPDIYVAAIDNVANTITLSGTTYHPLESGTVITFQAGAPFGSLTSTIQASFTDCHGLTMSAHGVGFRNSDSQASVDISLNDVSVDGAPGAFGALADAQSAVGTTIGFSTTNNFGWITFGTVSKYALSAYCPGYLPANGTTVVSISGTNVTFADATTSPIPANTVVYFAQVQADNTHIGFSIAGGSYGGTRARLYGCKSYNCLSTPLQSSGVVGLLAVRDSWFDAPILIGNGGNTICGVLNGVLDNNIFNGNPLDNGPILTIGNTDTGDLIGEDVPNTCYDLAITNNQINNVPDNQYGLVLLDSYTTIIKGNAFTPANQSGADTAGAIFNTEGGAFYTTIDDNDMTALNGASPVIAIAGGYFGGGIAPVSYVTVGFNNRTSANSTVTPILPAAFSSAIASGLSSVVDNTTLKVNSTSHLLYATGNFGNSTINTNVGLTVGTTLVVAGQGTIGGTLYTGTNLTGGNGGTILIGGSANQSVRAFGFANTTEDSNGNVLTSSNLWQFQIHNTQSGANAGADFFLNSFDDSGNSLNAGLIKITRSTGIVSIPGAITFGTIPTFGANVTKSYVLAAPTGANGQPVFRALLVADISNYTFPAIDVNFIGIPTASQVIFRKLFANTRTFPVGLAGSYASLLVAPAANLTLNLSRNGTTIGTILFLAHSVTGSFTFTSAITFNPGDDFRVVNAATADTAASGFTLALLPSA
jgi:hypothetical protein